jgi:hypothetical protein
MARRKLVIVAALRAVRITGAALLPCLGLPGTHPEELFMKRYAARPSKDVLTTRNMADLHRLIRPQKGEYK